MTWWCAALVLCGGLLLSGGCGCGKKPPPLPEVYTYRANDKAYMDSLSTNYLQQVEAAQAWAKTSMQMTQAVERVRATFPQGAGEDALAAALTADAEWQRLEALAKRQQEALEQVREDAKKKIQLRMLEENQAVLDVEAGQAKALDTPNALSKTGPLMKRPNLPERAEKQE